MLTTSGPSLLSKEGAYKARAGLQNRLPGIRVNRFCGGAELCPHATPERGEAVDYETWKQTVGAIPFRDRPAIVAWEALLFEQETGLIDAERADIHERLLSRYGTNQSFQPMRSMGRTQVAAIADRVVAGLKGGRS